MTVTLPTVASIAASGNNFACRLYFSAAADASHTCTITTGAANIVGALNNAGTYTPITTAAKKTNIIASASAGVGGEYLDIVSNGTLYYIYANSGTAAVFTAS